MGRTMTPLDRERRNQRLRRWLGGVFAVLWLAFAVWWQIIERPPQTADLHRQHFYQGTEGCTEGTTAQRYECREPQVLANERDLAFEWFLRVMIIAGPPLAVSLALALLFRPRRMGKQPTSFEID